MSTTIKIVPDLIKGLQVTNSDIELSSIIPKNRHLEVLMWLLYSRVDFIEITLTDKSSVLFKRDDQQFRILLDLWLALILVKPNLSRLFPCPHDMEFGFDFRIVKERLITRSNCEEYLTKGLLEFSKKLLDYKINHSFRLLGVELKDGERLVFINVEEDREKVPILINAVDAITLSYSNTIRSIEELKEIYNN